MPLHRLAVSSALVMSAALAGGTLFFEPASSAGDPPAFRTDTFMSLNTRGMRENTSTDPMRTVYEFDVHSNLTGEKIGTATDSVFCSTGWNDGSGYPGRLMADDWWIFEFGD